jgi:predicted transporter
MELKSLFVGIIFAIGIFAFKSGIGLNYIVSRKCKILEKVFLIFLFGIVYLTIFFICAQLLQKIDILNYYQAFQTLVQSGMAIHVLMAIGFTLWGIALLKKSKSTKTPTYGWLAMVVPCPVCVTVIFLSTAFLIAYFPDAGLWAPGYAYLTFMGIVIVTVLGMTAWGIKSNSTPESDMGAAMLFIAAYFFLSVIIMPQFGDVDKIYRIATYQSEKQLTGIKDVLLLITTTATFFILGFLYMKQKAKRRLGWI